MSPQSTPPTPPNEPVPPRPVNPEPPVGPPTPQPVSPEPPVSPMPPSPSPAPTPTAAPPTPNATPVPTVTPPAVPASPSPMQLNPAYGHDNLATASLILGIVSLPASILNILSLPIPIVGIVLGMISFKRKKSFALAGIILAVIGIILSIVVLVVGLKIQNSRKKSASPASPSTVHSVTGSQVSSNCYQFALPNGFAAADVVKNTDCTTTLVKADNTEDVAVTSSDLSTAVSASDHDTYLKNLANEFEAEVGSQAKFTNRKFMTLDGVRAYQATGSESYGNYKYIGYIVALSPKDYLSVSGAKLRRFIVAFDSASAPNRLDEVVQSWHWQ